MNDKTSLIDLYPDFNYYIEWLAESDDSCGVRYMSIESYINKTKNSDATILGYTIRTFNDNSH